MLNNISEVFSLEEVALENSDLLPQYGKKVIYFVTAMQGESKIFLYIGMTVDLWLKIKNHHRKIEFEFLKRIGYQINICWILFPDRTTQKKLQTMQTSYVQIFEPKLNEEQNTFAAVQAEEKKKRVEKWEQERYEYLKKKVEKWEQSGYDKDTIIKKIWEVCKQPLEDKNLILSPSKPQKTCV